MGTHTRPKPARTAPASPGQASPSLGRWILIQRPTRLSLSPSQPPSARDRWISIQRSSPHPRASLSLLLSTPSDQIRRLTHLLPHAPFFPARSSHPPLAAAPNFIPAEIYASLPQTGARIEIPHSRRAHFSLFPPRSRAQSPDFESAAAAPRTRSPASGLLRPYK